MTLSKLAVKKILGGRGDEGQQLMASATEHLTESFGCGTMKKNFFFLWFLCVFQTLIAFMT